VNEEKLFNSISCELHRLLAEQASILDRKEKVLAQGLRLSPAELECLCTMQGVSLPSLKDLGIALSKSGSDLSRTLDQLEDKGLITRAISKKDRRHTDAFLTHEAVELVKKVEQYWENHLDQILQKFPPEQIKSFIGFLTSLNELGKPSSHKKPETRNLS
jgi:DNA-binding MarR family transcriptional regulator